jgi:hypothetical protein
MITGLIETEEDLHRLLEKIRRACSKARPGTMFEEFTIVRRLPGNRPPLVQFIHGVMPEGYNPYRDTWKGGTRPSHKTTTRKRRKKNKRRATP